MPETQTIDADASPSSSPAVETVPAQETGSQETTATEQSTQTPQDTAQSQVETPVQATSEDAGREKPKPSDFYRERKQYQQLRDAYAQQQRELAELKDLVKQQKAPESVQPKPKPDIFVDPEGFLTEREQRLRQEIKQELLNEIRQTSQATEMERTKQEAVEMLFPKSGPDDKRSLQERIEANPELAEKIAKVEKEMGIHAVSNMNPKQGAALILKILESEKPKPVVNPTAIKKTLVGSTATGSPITAGGKVMPTLQEIQAQLIAQDKELDLNPHLRYEDSFVQKRKELTNSLSSLAKELQGKQ